MTKKMSWMLAGSLATVLALSGCNRAVRDGASIGVTDGLSDGLATVIADFIVAITPQPESDA